MQTKKGKSGGPPPNPYFSQNDQKAIRLIFWFRYFCPIMLDLFRSFWIHYLTATWHSRQTGAQCKCNLHVSMRFKALYCPEMCLQLVGSISLLQWIILVTSISDQWSAIKGIHVYTSFVRPCIRACVCVKKNVNNLSC